MNYSNKSFHCTPHSHLQSVTTKTRTLRAGKVKASASHTATEQDLGSHLPPLVGLRDREEMLTPSLTLLCHTPETLPSPNKETHSPEDLDGKIGCCHQMYPKTSNEFQVKVGHMDI